MSIAAGQKVYMKKNSKCMSKILYSGLQCELSISGNLPKDCREKDLERKFRDFGRLRDVLVKAGYGFVEYDDQRKKKKKS